jgi:transposase
MGQAIAITNRAHSATELRHLAARQKDAALVRRMLALALILEGHSRTAAARQNGLDRQTLCDWVHRYNAQGVAGLASRVPPGPTPRLDEVQRRNWRRWCWQALILRRMAWCAGAVWICARRCSGALRSRCTNAPSANGCAGAS